MKKPQAFSLTELAIVMVVISMIIAGTYTADGLRTQFKIQSIISEYQYYSRAIRSFQTQYNYLPGDFPYAGALWGLPATNNCTNAVVTAGCNGNGNGTLNNWNLFGGEGIRSWQHMSLAGMIAGNFNGNNNTIPNSIPSLKVQGSAIEFRQATLTVFDGAGSSNYLTIGGLRTDATNYGLSTQTGGTYAGATGNFLNVLEAQSIDTKIDDGIAYSGTILGVGNAVLGLATACSYAWTDVTSANYQVQNPGSLCSLMSKWNE